MVDARDDDWKPSAGGGLVSAADAGQRRVSGAPGPSQLDSFLVRCLAAARRQRNGSNCSSPCQGLALYEER